MVPVEKPGRATGDAAAATAVEDKDIGTATGAWKAVVVGPVEAWGGAPVLVGVAAEDAPLSPMATEPRAPIRSVVIKSIFTPREYTK